MMHRDASRCIMMHHDASWCIMMHHNASWCIMIHNDASWFNLDLARVGSVRKNSLFVRKMPSIRPRGHLPPGVFLPRSCPSFPTRRGRKGTRGDNTTTTTTWWRCPEAPCHHRAQGGLVNPFGYPPLSDNKRIYPYNMVSSNIPLI